MVKGAFSKYSGVRNSRGYTGADAARAILDRNGLSYIRIEHINGELTDHYDPSANVIRLSDSVYNNDSVAAVGVANLVKGDMIKEGCVIIDVGMNAVDDPNDKRGYHLCGDVDYKDVGIVWSIDGSVMRSAV